MSTAINSALRSAYDLAFQVSPIIMTGGNFSGNPMPVIGLIGQLASLAQGIATNGSLSLDAFYARYLVLPGGSAISNAVGTYPFANRQVAGNAIIEQPRNISLLMIAPVRDDAGYATKMALFTALQTSFQNHNRAGGTYTIMTPAMIYQDVVMVGMTDATGGETNQRQVQWQIDFYKPLISASDAQAAFNNQLSAISGGQVLTQSSPTGISQANSYLAGAI